MVVELLQGAPEQNNDSLAPFRIRSVCAAVTADQLAGCQGIAWVCFSSGGNNDDIIRISNWFLHKDFSSARIFAVQTSSARFVCCCFPAMCSLMTPLQNTLDINYLCHFMCTEELSQCSEVHPVSLLNSPATCVLWPYYGFPVP